MEVTTGFVSHKEPMIGWAIQTALGIPATVATIIFPLPQGTDFGPKLVKEIYQVNMGNQERAHYFLKSKSSSGAIKFPLIPGMLITSSDFEKWLWRREATGQSLYATIFMYLGHDLGTAANYLVCPDVKCTGGQFDVAEEEMVYLSAECLGGPPLSVADTGSPYKPVTTNFPAYPNAAYMDGVPYTYGDARIRLSFAGAALGNSPDFLTKGHTIKWNNMVVDQSGGTFIMEGRDGPYELMNTARAQWSVGFSRVWYDIKAMTDYLSETGEGKYECRFVKGAITGTLTLPRTIISGGGIPKLPSDDVLKNDLELEALGSAGVPGTACFSWTEAA